MKHQADPTGAPRKKPHLGEEDLIYNGPCLGIDGLHPN